MGADTDVDIQEIQEEVREVRAIVMAAIRWWISQLPPGTDWRTISRPFHHGKGRESEYYLARAVCNYLKGREGAYAGGLFSSDCYTRQNRQVMHDLGHVTGDVVVEASALERDFRRWLSEQIAFWLQKRGLDSNGLMGRSEVSGTQIARMLHDSGGSLELKCIIRILVALGLGFSVSLYDVEDDR